MKTFVLGNDSITFDDNVEFYAKYMGAFYEMAFASVDSFGTKIEGCKSVEEILKSTPVWAEKEINSAISSGIDMLLENGIVEYDVERFKRLCGNDLDFTSFSGYFELYQQYNNVELAERERIKQKNYERATRSRWQGGGFGIRGAVKGAVKAGAMNMVTDTFRSVGDTAVDSADKRKFQSMRQSLLTDEAKRNLTDIIFVCIASRVGLQIMELLQQYTGKDASKVLRSEEEKASAIFGNLERITDKEQKWSYIKQIIELDPFEWTYMGYLLDHHKTFKIPLCDVKNMASFFCQYTTKEWDVNDFAREIGEASRLGFSQSVYNRLRKVALEKDYIDENNCVKPQTYKFIQKAPQVAIRALVTIEIGIKYESIQNALKIIKDASPYELESIYSTIKDICKKHHLIKKGAELVVKDDLLDDSDNSRRINELLIKLNQAYKSACLVDGIQFKMLSDANHYRDDLKQFESVYRVGTSYADYKSKKLVAVVESLHQLKFITPDIQVKVKELESRVEILKEHESTVAYKRGKELLSVFEPMQIDNLYKYGQEGFLSAAYKAKTNKTVKKTENDAYPLLVYNTDAENGIKGFVITEQFLYDLSGILGLGSKAIELSKIASIVIRNANVEFVLQDGKKSKIKLPTNINTKLFVETLAEAIHLPKDCIVCDVAKAKDVKVQVEEASNRNVPSLNIKKPLPKLSEKMVFAAIGICIVLIIFFASGNMAKKPSVNAVAITTERAVDDSEDITNTYKDTYKEAEVSLDTTDVIRSMVSDTKSGVVAAAEMESQESEAFLQTSGEESQEGDYILPYASERVLSDEEINSLSEEQLRLAINEIYAKHGRKFSTEDLRTYFESKSWYTGSLEQGEFDECVLNAIEKENIQKLAERRSEIQGESEPKEKELSGKYESVFGNAGGAELEITYSSGDDIYIASLSGSYLDSAGEVAGYLIAYTDGTDGVWELYEQIAFESRIYNPTLRLFFDGADVIEVESLDGNTYGGMLFPGFGGMYVRTAEYPMP